MAEKNKQIVMFYVYLRNIKSATKPHVTLTVSLTLFSSRNISINMLLERAQETGRRRLSAQTHSVHCIMSHCKPEC